MRGKELTNATSTGQHPGAQNRVEKKWKVDPERETENSPEGGTNIWRNKQKMPEHILWVLGGHGRFGGQEHICPLEGAQGFCSFFSPKKRIRVLVNPTQGKSPWLGDGASKSKGILPEWELASVLTFISFW